MLGAAVIGLGVGAQHAKAFARTEGCELRWLHDHDAARAEALRVEIGAGDVAKSFDAILEDPKTDIVSLATYDDHHGDQVVRALDAGKHVFCEKPLCHTEAELAAIERAWKKSGRHLACNLVLRAAPVYAWLREAIGAGEFGEVYAVDGDYLYGRVHKITDGWRKNVDDYSVLLGGGVHMVDLMMWATGQRPDAVSAVGNRVATRGSAFRYDDFAAATFTFPSGMIGRITANFGCVHRHQHVVRVFGTKKTFLYDDQGPRVWRARGDASENHAEKLNLSPLPATKGDLIPSFIRSLQAGSDGRESTRHELALVAACIASHRAHTSGLTTRITYP